MFLPQHFIWNKNVFWLSPNKSVFWEAEKILILSDVHLGKTSHFRKAGIAIPNAVFKKDIHKLTEDIQYFQPKKIIIVGDLFHSVANKENDLFLKWRNSFLHIPITLVQGNHDILEKEWYKKAGINVIENAFIRKAFIFQHDNIIETKNEDKFVFTGHLHPGFMLKGKGKQTITFPCFYFSKKQCILPAYGNFTGYVMVEKNKEDTIFAIVENSIIAF
jgi:DNA ligase-associated metallophosphoesterase